MTRWLYMCVATAAMVGCSNTPPDNKPPSTHADIEATSSLQPTSEQTTRRAAIEAMHPIMVQALAAGQFAKARELAQKAIEWEPTLPVHQYNLACVESRAGEKKAALAALQRAVGLGYADFESFRIDEDLASILSEPEFARIEADAVANAMALAKVAPAAPGAPTPGPAVPVDTNAPAAGGDAGPRLGIYDILTVYGTTSNVTSRMVLKAGGIYEILDTLDNKVRSTGNYRYDAAKVKVVWLSGLNFDMGRSGSFKVRDDGVHRIGLGSKTYAEGQR